MEPWQQGTGGIWKRPTQSPMGSGNQCEALVPTELGDRGDKQTRFDLSNASM